MRTVEPLALWNGPSLIDTVDRKERKHYEAIRLQLEQMWLRDYPGTPGDENDH